MELMILGQSLDDPRYRGTERTSPYYQEQLPPSHPANQAFLWYVNEGEWEGRIGCGIVRDVVRACALIQEYRRLDPPQQFELIRMAVGSAKPQPEGEFLGFDVTELGLHSILSNGLRYDPDQAERAGIADEGYRRVAPLLRLLKESFSRRLNANVLFDEKSMADYCCECARALITCAPNLFDMPMESLVVVGLYVVD